MAKGPIPSPRPQPSPSRDTAPPRVLTTPSPYPPDDGRDEKTPAHFLVTSEYVKNKVGGLETAVEEALKRHDNKLTVRSVIVAAGAVGVSVIAALVFIDNRVHAETDAGVRIVVERHEALKSRVETIERRMDRIDDKLDLALDALRVPQSKRPPPIDGGQQ